MPYEAAPPAFQFYPKDFLTSLAQATMSLEEAGAYIRLLCHCWLEGAVPDDPVACGRLVGATPEEMARIWPTVRNRFDVDGATLRNARLDHERQKQEEFRVLRQQRGKAGARARWQSETRGELADGWPEHAASNGPSIPQAMPADGSSSSIFNLQSSSSVQEHVRTADAVLARVVALKTDAHALKTTVAAEFDAFWQAYPRHIAKQAAVKAWRALHPSIALQELILAAIAAQKTWDAWIREGGQYVPYPVTWLNQHRWDDEPPAEGSSARVRAPTQADADAQLEMLRKADAQRERDRAS